MGWETKLGTEIVAMEDANADRRRWENCLAANYPHKHEFSLSYDSSISHAFADKTSDQSASAQICGEKLFLRFRQRLPLPVLGKVLHRHQRAGIHVVHVHGSR